MSCNSDLYCTSCQSTYAIVNNRYCFKCDSTDSGSLIMGVPNCTKCKAPSTGHGSVHCLEYSSQPQNETGSRSNATGIAVGVTIAILAIAGVIGFLVWWFVCKKKTNKVNMPPKLSSNSSIVSSRIGLM
ncbi:Variant-specific surface protein [Giardia duodenalis]|uniref:Variant-specific surface protein n=1 Tax=Giardia intestinalis TaxID=5741 RepID=V6TCW0_GIAIN|nr:Variant-specific surface protein [Giardia intestinalis]